jgi:hypothetical protein
VGSEPRKAEQTVRPEKVVSQADVMQNNGEISTFITCVKFRQNSTWQGEMYWKENDTKMRFLNLLEFIKQIDQGVSV